MRVCACAFNIFTNISQIQSKQKSMFYIKSMDTVIGWPQLQLQNCNLEILIKLDNLKLILL